MSRCWSYARPFLLPLLVVLVWEVIVRLGYLPPSHSAAPTQVFLRLTELFRSFELFNHSARSLGRLFAGVLLGSAFGIFWALTTGLLANARIYIHPTIQLFAGIPVVIWIPVSVMLFGSGEAFKLIIVFASTFFVVYGYTFHSIRLLPVSYLELAQIYGKSIWKQVFEIYLPHSLPTIFHSVRLSLVFGWVVLFFVEYASARQGSEGLGWFIADAREMGRVESEFSGMIVLGVLAYGTDALISKVQRECIMWADAIEIEIEK